MTPVPPDDVVVVGAGPAGSVTAALLAREGWGVTLLERADFPRPKACGECLNPGAVAALRRLGLLERVLALSPAVLDGWELRSGDLSASADFPLRVGTGLALPRAPLDATLLDAARAAGTAVAHGVAVRRVGEPLPDGTRPLFTRGPDGAPGVRCARVVVGADGLRSVVARSVSAPRRPPRLRKLSLTARVRGRRAQGHRGLLVLTDTSTVGLAPVDQAGDLWNLTVVVAAARDGRAVAKAPLDFLLRAAGDARLEWLQGPEVEAGPWASGPFDWPMRAPAADALLLVGDAAGYYDPLTGQGIFRALRSAELAADAIDSALRKGRVSGAALRTYVLRHRVAFSPGSAVQRAVEAVISRPFLRELAVGRLAQRPDALRVLVGVTGDGAPVRSLLGLAFLGALVQRAPRSKQMAV